MSQQFRVSISEIIATIFYHKAYALRMTECYIHNQFLTFYYICAIILYRKQKNTFNFEVTNLMKRRQNIYDKSMPYTDYDHDSAEEVLALLEAHTEMAMKKGSNLVIRNFDYLYNQRQVFVSPIENDRITPYHRHEFYEINYVYSGRVGQFIDGKTFILEEGELLFMSPSIYHISLPIGTDTKAINILLRSDFIDHELSKMRTSSSNCYLQQLIKNPLYLIFKSPGKSDISNIINELENTILSNGEYLKPYQEIFARNIAEKLLIMLNYAEKHSVNYTPPKIDLNKDERNKRIVQYMLDNYATVTLEEMAKYFSFSTQQIRRIVKESTGLTFADNVRRKRISKARTYLVNTDMSVAQIAKHIGIDSPEYFSRRFKNDIGCSPLEYRASGGRYGEKSTASEPLKNKK